MSEPQIKQREPDSGTIDMNQKDEGTLKMFDNAQLVQNFKKSEIDPLLLTSGFSFFFRN